MNNNAVEIVDKNSYVIHTTKLRKVCERKKSEKYECTTCGGICYFPHSTNEIWYDFCPCCGRAVIRIDS